VEFYVQIASSKIFLALQEFACIVLNFSTDNVSDISSLLSNSSCLDRTNVAQFSAGVEAIGQQLVVMGIRSKAKLDPCTSNIVRVLIDMYV